MSSPYTKVIAPPPLALSDAARAATEAFTAKLSSVLRALWCEMERAGQARAQRELQRLAVRYAHNPEMTKVFRDAMRQAASRQGSANY